MPGWWVDVNKLVGRHTGTALILVITALGSVTAAGTVLIRDISSEVSANEARSQATQEQLSQHLRRESRYNREVRQVLDQMSTSISQLQSDVAVLRERSDRESQ